MFPKTKNQGKYKFVCSSIDYEPYHMTEFDLPKIIPPPTKGTQLRFEFKEVEIVVEKDDIITFYSQKDNESFDAVINFIEICSDEEEWTFHSDIGTITFYYKNGKLLPLVEVQKLKTKRRYLNIRNIT